MSFAYDFVEIWKANFIDVVKRDVTVWIHHEIIVCFSHWINKYLWNVWWFAECCLLNDLTNHVDEVVQKSSLNADSIKCFKCFIHEVKIWFWTVDICWNTFHNALKISLKFSLSLRIHEVVLNLSFHLSHLMNWCIWHRLSWCIWSNWLLSIYDVLTCCLYSNFRLLIFLINNLRQFKLALRSKILTCFE